MSVDESLHTAEVDVMATLDILEAMVHVYPELARLKRDELVPFQAAAHRQWPSPSTSGWPASTLIARAPSSTGPCPPACNRPARDYPVVATRPVSPEPGTRSTRRAPHAESSSLPAVTPVRRNWEPRRSS